LRGGMGWYRKTFTLPASSKNKHVFIDFDGVYMNSEVFINGHSLGIRPNGYISFRYELTPFLKFGAEKNVIAVKVNNESQPNSRWYSGSGIYRNVWLVTTSDVFVDHWGTYITTPEINKTSATLHIETSLVNSSNKTQRISLQNIIYDAEGKEVARKKASDFTLDNISGINTDATISNPHLWSTTDPYLYKAVTQIISNGKIVDEYTTSFGIRYFNFDVDKGFSLNGKPLKIIGVCDHHDLGCLGAAINTRALQRQLEILKGMGINGIRTSHNPPAPELLDLCDKMGFIVMDEAFDIWKIKKTDFDYHLDWDEWHKRDLEDMVLRDRNHPSVIIWSIGNEVMEQWNQNPEGGRISRELIAIVRNLDKSRPITSACNGVDVNNKVLTDGGLDIVGTNYHQGKIPELQKMFPGRVIIGTETTSAVQSRDTYLMPSDEIRRWPRKWDEVLKEGTPDFTCSAYDNSSAPWGSTHEETWKIVKKHDFFSGMFIWTGWDYLGEPTPYPWPAVSSYFGIIDLAGFPKDSFYMYQSEWTNNPVLHLFPHWNWKPGEKVDVVTYFNADEVELFLNGRSQGTKRKQGDDMQVFWRLPFEPGVLKAVSRKNGQVMLTREVRTAEAPARIVLVPDRQNIKADGVDLSFVTVKVVDRNGTVVPLADNLIKFELTGDGSIAGVDNGYQASHESFKAKQRKAFRGMALAIVQAKQKPGQIVLKASSDNLAPASVVINVR